MAYCKTCKTISFSSCVSEQRNQYAHFMCVRWTFPSIMSSNSGSASAMLLNSCISSLYVLDTSTTCMTWRLASGACKLLKTAFKFQTSYVSRGYDGEHKRGGIIVQWWTVAVAGSPKVQCAISATCWPPRHRNRSVCKSSSLLKSLTAIDSQCCLPNQF